MIDMKKICQRAVRISALCFFILLPTAGFCDEVEFPSSFNPVGSGARAIAMGGAFIAVADDATAASWNPGGLIQLTKPECSIVGTYTDRTEDIDYGKHPEAYGSRSIYEPGINYLSATYPFNWLKRNMVISLSYQHLFDFNRDWKFTLLEPAPISSEEHWDYQQEGNLTALGLSWCIQIIPQLAAGFTLNIWDDDLTENKWKQKFAMDGFDNFGNVPTFYTFSKIETFSFNGINANFGILWRNRKNNLSIGAVLKTPFTADIRHEEERWWTETYPTYPKADRDDYEIRVSDEKLDMPMSYGIGIACDLTHCFSMSADIYRTEWDDFIYRNKDGNEFSAVSNLSLDKSDVEPTHQVRLGGEYLIINEDKRFVMPIRAGIFYDPAPAEGSPDDIYGFSMGMGFTQNDRFSLDVAYQYRFANNIGEHMIPNQDFSIDISEHKIYCSLILYWDIFKRNNRLKF